jgi:hypothetical protein
MQLWACRRDRTVFIMAGKLNTLIKIELIAVAGWYN